jgi:hypothetical protein
VGSQQPTNEWGGEEVGRSKGRGGGVKDTCVCGVKARTIDGRKKVESSNVMDPSLADAANNNNTPSAPLPNSSNSSAAVGWTSKSHKIAQKKNTSCALEQNS